MVKAQHDLLARGDAEEAPSPAPFPNALGAAAQICDEAGRQQRASARSGAGVSMRRGVRGGRVRVCLRTAAHDR